MMIVEHMCMRAALMILNSSYYIAERRKKSKFAVQPPTCYLQTMLIQHYLFPQEKGGHGQHLRRMGHGARYCAA